MISSLTSEKLLKRLPKGRFTTQEIHNIPKTSNYPLCDVLEAWHDLMCQGKVWVWGAAEWGANVGTTGVPE